VILGEENTVAQGSASDILFMVSRAIEGTERQEESFRAGRISGNGCRSANPPGRERARIDQSAYEQILNDFISEGELGWKYGRLHGLDLRAVLRTSEPVAHGVGTSPQTARPGAPARHH
jgi:hypothetical protein